jgi:hypothetical protein
MIRSPFALTKMTCDPKIAMIIYCIADARQIKV